MIGRCWCVPCPQPTSLNVLVKHPRSRLRRALKPQCRKLRPYLPFGRWGRDVLHCWGTILARLSTILVSLPLARFALKMVTVYASLTGCHCCVILRFGLVNQLVKPVSPEVRWRKWISNSDQTGVRVIPLIGINQILPGAMKKSTAFLACIVRLGQFKHGVTWPRENINPCAFLWGLAPNSAVVKVASKTGNKLHSKPAMSVSSSVKIFSH